MSQKTIWLDCGECPRPQFLQTADCDTVAEVVEGRFLEPGRFEVDIVGVADVWESGDGW